MSGTGNDVIYIYPTSTNSNVPKTQLRFLYQTGGGVSDSIDLEQTGQVTFNLNPSPWWYRYNKFDHSGSVTSGQSNGTLSSNVSWVLNITGIYI